jgi:N-methylhydantoinase A
VLISGREMTAARIAAEVRPLLERLGEGLAEAEPEITYQMRYRGQAFELGVPGPADPDPAELAERFAAAHEERYGYRDPAGEIEVVAIRETVREPGPDVELAGASDAPSGRIVGPQTVRLPEATLVVPQGWAGEQDATGTIVLERTA